jgi:hypothetical protein
MSLVLCPVKYGPNSEYRRPMNRSRQLPARAPGWETHAIVSDIVLVHYCRITNGREAIERIEGADLKVVVPPDWHGQ